MSSKKRGTYSLSGYGYGTLDDGSSFSATEIVVDVVEDDNGVQQMYAVPPPDAEFKLMVRPDEFFNRGAPVTNEDGERTVLHRDGVQLMAEKIEELEKRLVQKKYEVAALKNENRVLTRMNKRLLDKLFVVVEAGVAKFLKDEDSETP